MCLAVPLEIVRIEGEMGVVESGGIRRPVNLSLVESPKVGDYAIVHAGFAITIMDRREAERTLALIAEYLEAAEGESK